MCLRVVVHVVAWALCVVSGSCKELRSSHVKMFAEPEDFCYCVYVFCWRGLRAASYYFRSPVLCCLKCVVLCL
jgi:hypothetical protein